MKKFIKNNILGFILGILVASVTTVLALDAIVSKQVTFSPENPDEWEARDVETALNDLYGFASTRKSMQLVASNVRIYNGEGIELDTHISDNNCLAVKAGTDIEGYTVKYQEPLLWKISEVISLLGVVTFIIFIIRSKRKM